MIMAIFDVEERLVKREKCFLTTILIFFYNVFKNRAFLDHQKSACLVLKLTREVSISSVAKSLLTTILSFLYNVFKSLPFLDRQKSTCLVLKLTREVSISSLAKKATFLICRHGVYGQRLVFNRIERSRKYIYKKKKTVLPTIELQRR